MNIISEFKNLFTSNAVSPMTSKKISPMTPKSNFIVFDKCNVKTEDETTKKEVIKADWMEIKKVAKFTSRLAKSISRLFGCAISFIVLAHFVPELREQLPSLYSVVDFLMVCLEKIFALICQIF